MKDGPGMSLPNWTEETKKARPFQRQQNYFLGSRNDLAFIVYDV
jgi:hypothetical protein